MASLLLVRGLPGSGKSFLATFLQSCLGVEQTCIVDPDKIDKQSPDYIELCDTFRSEGVEDIYFPHRYLRRQAETALKDGKTVIWNQAFTLETGFIRTVDYLTGYAKAHHFDLNVVVVEVEIDPFIARQRIDDRATAGGHNVPDEAFRRFTSDYKSFAHLGYTTVIVNGNDPVETSAKKVRDALV